MSPSATPDEAGNTAARADEVRGLIDQAASLPRTESDSAAGLLRRALDLAVAARMPLLEALARHKLGCLLRRKPATKEEGLGELNRALDLRVRLADVRGQIECEFELGLAAFQSSDLGSALPHLHEAERLCRRSPNPEAQVDTWETLAGVYGTAGQSEKGLEYARLCLDAARQLGDPGRITNALDSVACCESELDRHDEAQQHFKDSLAAAGGIEDLHKRAYAEAMVRVDLAEAMCRARRWQIATRAADEAIAIAGTRDWAGVKAQALFCKARAMLALGEGETVERSLHEAYRLFQSTGNKNFLSKTERELSTFYAGRGDYRRAFEFLERAMATEMAMRRDAAMHQMAQQNAREKLDQLTENSARLELASKHKTEFLANMSHELRTPLNAIIGFSEVLIERMFGELNDRQADYLKDIHGSGKHLLSLINDILDLSKIEAGHMQLELTRFHLPSALSDAMALVRERALRHGIELSLNFDARIDEIQADERKFKQMVLNLLSNAVKFTPDGGRVDVSAQVVDHGIEIAVRDTGIGISPEDQGVLFAEFKQVGGDHARNAEGTGLGLALTKRLVALHGGEIRIESAPGKGSTFAFTLPSALAAP